MLAVYKALHVIVIKFVQSFVYVVKWCIVASKSDFFCTKQNYFCAAILSLYFCLYKLKHLSMVWILLCASSSLVNAASLPPNVWFPWSAAQYTTASSLARQIDRPLSVVFLLLCWCLGGVKGLLLFSSGTFIMEKPTQPDQIRPGEEEAGMFLRVRVKLVLNFHTFGVRWYHLMIY